MAPRGSPWLPMSHTSTSLGMPGDPSLWTVPRISSPVHLQEVAIDPQFERPPFHDSNGNTSCIATTQTSTKRMHRDSACTPSSCRLLTESLQFASSASQARVGGPLRCLSPEESITRR